jgi:hypothetical protein
VLRCWFDIFLQAFWWCSSQSLVSELMLILLNAEAFQISGPGGIFLWKGKRFALILYLERRGKGKRKTLDWAG